MKYPMVILMSADGQTWQQLTGKADANLFDVDAGGAVVSATRAIALAINNAKIDNPNFRPAMYIEGKQAGMAIAENDDRHEL